MKRYCFVIELKEEHVDEYVKLHRNAWPQMLEAIKRAGAKEELLYIYKNISIVFFECEDIDELYKKLDNEEVVEKWNAVVKPWMNSDFVFLDKIFDLNQQLEDGLKQY
jgi:L-rhamnose mutarotase